MPTLVTIALPNGLALTPSALIAVSVSSAWAVTSRPAISTKLKATLAPRWAKSRQMARPNPVAPPVTTTTRPDRFSPARCSSGRSCTTAAPAGAGASREASVHEYGAKEFEPMFEFEARQAEP